MVIALDRATYPVKEANGIAPCADGAGVIEAVGEGSRWKKGERVVVQPSGWMEGDVPELKGMKVKGAEDVEGTLRDFMVLVCMKPLVFLFSLRGRIGTGSFGSRWKSIEIVVRGC